MDTQSILTKLKNELAALQTKADEARIQMDLAGKEIQSTLEPYLKKLDTELLHTRRKLEKLKSSAEDTEHELEKGVHSSIDKMKELYEKAKQHLPKK
jgi:chromosome segregation ATPase